MLKISRSLSAPLKFVWLSDPALDHKHQDFVEKWRAFLDDGGDVESLPVKEGLKPAVFDVMPLSRQGWLTMQAAGVGLEMALEAVRYGLKQIHNVQVDGVDFKINPETDYERDGNEKRLKSDVLDRLWDPGLFADLGTFIMQKSKLPPPSGQG